MTTMQARPTVYRGIQMRSRLEAGFAMWLDSKKATWAHEPCAYGHPTLGQYLPDFDLGTLPTTNGDARVFVEVKPTGYLDPHVDIADYDDTHDREMDRAARIIHENIPGAWLVICQPPPKGTPGSVVPVLVKMEEDTRFWWPNPDLAWGWFQGRGLGLVSIDRFESGPWFGEWWKGADA